MLQNRIWTMKQLLHKDILNNLQFHAMDGICLLTLVNKAFSQWISRNLSWLVKAKVEIIIKGERKKKKMIADLFRFFV